MKLQNRRQSRICPRVESDVGAFFGARRIATRLRRRVYRCSGPTNDCPGSCAHLRYSLVQGVISMCMRPRRRATGTELWPKPSLQCLLGRLLCSLGPAILLRDADADSSD
jgi:hypothetical protein